MMSGNGRRLATVLIGALAAVSLVAYPAYAVDSVSAGTATNTYAFSSDAESDGADTDGSGSAETADTADTASSDVSSADAASAGASGDTTFDASPSGESSGSDASDAELARNAVESGGDDSADAAAESKSDGDTAADAAAGEPGSNEAPAAADSNAAVASTEATPAAVAAADTGDFTVSGGTAGQDYVYDAEENTLTFQTSGSYTVTGTANTQSAEQIVIGADLTVTLTLENVSAKPNGAGMKIDGSSTVTLLLRGENHLEAGVDEHAGVEFANATTGSLTIDSAGESGSSTGSLTAVGKNGAAGIGGGRNTSSSNITISGGTVTATGGGYGAGIGGGWQGAGSHITVSGGTVTAKGGSNAAGIGGGYQGAGSNIEVSGGTVTATGGEYGAGIGGGNIGIGSYIEVSDGSVTATGGGYAAGIGGGNGGAGSDITISGGAVTAKGGNYAAGIGGGCQGAGSNIEVSGGTVSATGGNGGAGIGGGAHGTGSDIEVFGGTVSATGGDSAAGIGRGAAGSDASNIVISNGSVKAVAGANSSAAAISTTPTDGNGNAVYEAKVPVASSMDSVTATGSDPSFERTFARAGSHPDDDSFYVYLPYSEGSSESYTLTAGDDTYTAAWDDETGAFTVFAIAVSADYVVSGGTYGVDYVYDSAAKTLTFIKGGSYTVSNREDVDVALDQLVVGADLKVTLTLDGVIAKPNGAGMSIDGSSTVALLLKGENSFEAGAAGHAGVEFANATTGSLTIDSADESGSTSGSLNATGGNNAAGIGGGSKAVGSHITISGGTVTAKGTMYGAGIGGGLKAAGSYITISGGVVIATGQWAAGIGGSNNNNQPEAGGVGSHITISGGVVTATGDQWAAGIGGGARAVGSDITISGGVVTATSAGILGRAAGIGGGLKAAGLNITISGGTVTATGGQYADGIGSGYQASEPSSNIIISDGSVRAVAGSGGVAVSVTPTDDNGKNVYEAKVPVASGVNQVTVSELEDKEFTRAGDHPDDSAFYVYLPHSEGSNETYTLVAGGEEYAATWTEATSTFTVTEVPDVQVAPAPNASVTATANSLTVTVVNPETDTYGALQYRWDNGDWGASATLAGLQSDKSHTVQVRYAGNETYTLSETTELTASTAEARYTVTIPATATAGGNAKSIALADGADFDLGAGGKVRVTVKSGVDADSMVTLAYRGGSAESVESKFSFGNNSLLTSLNTPVAVFATKDDPAVPISFATPTSTSVSGIIAAGMYKGTVTFSIDYTESN